jgi:CheY-like chemotaxis protein
MTAATALVVDDEPMVRYLVRRILEPEVCGVVEWMMGKPPCG